MLVKNLLISFIALQAKAICCLLILTLGQQILPAADAPSLILYDHTKLTASVNYGAVQWSNKAHLITPGSGALIRTIDDTQGNQPWSGSYSPYSSGPPYDAGDGSWFNMVVKPTGGYFIIDTKRNVIWSSAGGSYALPAGSILRNWNFKTGGAGYQGVSSAMLGDTIYVLKSTSGTSHQMAKITLNSNGTCAEATQSVTFSGVSSVTWSWGGMAAGNGYLWLYERMGGGKLNPKIWRIDPASMSGTGYTVSFRAPNSSTVWPVGYGLAFNADRLYLYDNGPVAGAGGQNIWELPLNGGAHLNRYSLPWATSLSYTMFGVGMGFGVPVEPKPVVTFVPVIGPFPPKEGGGHYFFVRREVTTQSPLAVKLFFQGTAEFGFDYSIVLNDDSGNPITSNWDETVVIPAGMASASILLNFVDDLDYEGTESVSSMILNDPAYEIGNVPSDIVYVDDNDPKPVVTVSAVDAVGAEGGGNNITVRASRDGNSGYTAVWLNLTSSLVTGSSGFENYNPYCLTILNGETSKDYVLVIPDDTIVDGTEQIQISIEVDPLYTIGAASSAVFTVNDNDKPQVQIGANPATATEGGAAGAFVVTRANTSLFPTIVKLGAPTGTAASSDFAALPTTVTIPAGVGPSTVTVPLAAVDDANYEVPETVIVGVVADPSYTISGPSSATVTISDNDKPTITISASDNSATEGGSDNATFTFSRAIAGAGPVTVKYQVTGGAATSGSDFIAFSGTATIQSGAVSVVVTLSPTDDTIPELPETVVLGIVSDPTYIVGLPSSATATIYDNEAPVITVAASDASAKEGGADNGKFTVTRLGSRAAAITVNIGRTGSAGAGSDYTALPATAAITVNSNTVDIPVTVTEDAVPEPDETVVVTVQSGTGYTVGTPSTATVTVSDNETPTLSIAATDATAAEEGLSTGAFTITRLGAKSTALTVNLNLTGSTATNGTDFDTIANTLTLGANVVNANITVKPKEDTEREVTESVVCAITSGTGYSVGTPSSAAVNIADNDTQTVTIVATSAGAAEPATNGAFVVRRVGPTVAALTVSYTIATGTGRATNGTDYATIPTSVTIPINSTDSAPIPITVTDDSSYEGPETVQLTISSNAAYVVGSPSSATVTIADNDKPTVTVSLVDGAANEPSDTGKYRFTRNGILTLGSLAVKYTMSGRAINGTDYSSLSGTAVIASGQASVDLTLTPMPDAVIEGSETATLTIVADPAYNIGATSSASIIIGSSLISTIAGTPPVYGEPIEGGSATTSPLDYPVGLAVDASGNKFIADVYSQAIWRVTPAGIMNRYAGQAYLPGKLGVGGPATAAGLNSPEGVAVDGSGNLYIADTNNHRICKVTASTGILTVVVGSSSSPRPGFIGDGGLATAAQLRYPSAIAVDSAGNLYVADTANHRIRKVTASSGIITTIVGNGTAASTGDGAAATAASVNGPKGLDLDAAGNIYVADTGGSRIRKVTVSSGVITTIAGNGTAGYAGDGGNPTAAMLNTPQGVAVSDGGEVFIADTDNHRIRKIEAGLIITVAGNGTAGFSGDNGAATLAKLNRPVGLAFDVSGNLFLADVDNAGVRRLSAGISAIARRAVQGAQQVLLALNHSWSMPQSGGRWEE